MSAKKNRNKVSALSWTKKVIGLHGCEKATLVKIADNIRDIVNGECYKAIPNIAKEHGISARTLEYGLTGRTDRKTGKRVVQGLESRGILVAVGGKKGGGFRYDDEGNRCGITTRWKINIPILFNYLSNANAKALREKLGWDVPKPPTLPADDPANESANDLANESANESAKVEASVRKSGGDESAKVGKSVRNIADNILSTSPPEQSTPDKPTILTRDSIAEVRKGGMDGMDGDAPKSSSQNRGQEGLVSQNQKPATLWTALQLEYDRTHTAAGKIGRKFPLTLSKVGLPDMEAFIKASHYTQDEVVEGFGFWLLRKYSHTIGASNEIKHPLSVFAEDADAYIQIQQRDEAEDAEDVEEPEDEPVPA